jgi:nicotinate-nucleotide adenylyltransferase
MIGILGGTFDPVHFGHLRPALEIRQALALDEIRLIPCHLPPHRPRPVASPQQRVAMLEAAVRKYPEFRIDPRELAREGPSYTLDTLTSLREEMGETGLCLLTGRDAFSSLPTWHRWRELIDLCHMVVMTRPGPEAPAAAELANFIQRHRVQDAALLEQQAAGLLLFRPVTQLEISATQVRRLLAQGHNAGFLLPEAVLDIIQQQGLYQTEDN